MTTHQHRHHAEDAGRKKEKGHAEAQPTSETTKPYSTKKDSTRFNPKGVRVLRYWLTSRHIKP